MSARVTRLAKVANGATRIGPVVVNVADLRGILATVADLRRRIREALAAYKYGTVDDMLRKLDVRKPLPRAKGRRT